MRCQSQRLSEQRSPGSNQSVLNRNLFDRHPSPPHCLEHPHSAVNGRTIHRASNTRPPMLQEHKKKKKGKKRAHVVVRAVATSHLLSHVGENVVAHDAKAASSPPRPPAAEPVPPKGERRGLAARPDGGGENANHGPPALPLDSQWRAPGRKKKIGFRLNVLLKSREDLRFDRDREKNSR